MSHYLVIDIKVSKASMLQSNSFLSPMPVLATVLAMHALDKKLGDQYLGIQGVGIIHHSYTPWMEWMDDSEKDQTYLHPELVQRRGAYLFDSIKEPQATPLQPMALCDLEWTLLLACEKSISGSVDSIGGQLTKMRLAGGVIVQAKVRQFDDWDDATAVLRSGFWVEDASQLLAPPSTTESTQATTSSPIQALLSAVYGAERWVMPANLGYALLEPPQSRRGARDALPHAFAEHLMGLVRLTSIHAVKNRTHGLQHTDLWRYGWIGDQFVVSNAAHLKLSACMSPSTSIPV